MTALLLQSNDSPGGLTGETCITLQSRQAQRCVAGRRRAPGIQPIIGLKEFGIHLKVN